MSTVADKSTSTDLQGLRELYFELGQALSQRERLAEAIQAFEQALKEEGATPGGDVVLLNLGQTQDRACKPENAFQSYLEAIAVAPQRMAEILPRVDKLLTRDLAIKEGEWLKSQWEPRIKTAELASALRAEVARFLGRVSLYRGEYARSEELFREADHLRPNDPLVLEGLGEVLWHTGKIPEALQLLTSAHDITEKSDRKDRLAIIDAKLAQALVAAGQYQAALDMIAKSLEGGGRFTNQLLLSRTQCYLGLARWDEALEAAKAVQEKSPASIEARILSSQAFIALGRYSDADKVVDEGLQYDLQNLDLLLYKAEALLEGQIDLEQARRLLARYAERAGSAAVAPSSLPPALVARSADGNAQHFMAELYRALGRPDDALKAVDKALELGLKKGEEDYREAPAQQLKAELLEKRGELDQAANFYFEAGRRFLWRNEYENAVEQLRRSTGLDKSRAATYWYRADALRMLTSQASVSQEEKKRTIEESIRVWDQGTEFGFSDADMSWAYVVRALICEQCANLLATDLSQQRTRYWEGAAFTEQALLLYDTNPYGWAYLGRYHRTLGNEANALRATEMAWKSDEENLAVQEERAAILANVGHLEEATKVIDKRRAAAPNSWADSIKAYVLAEKRLHKEALNLIGPVIKAEPEVLWYLDLHARCLRMLGERTRALDDYKTLWTHYDAKNFNDQIIFGVSAYYLGEIEQAIKILSDYVAADVDIGAYWYLGACHLAQNHQEDGEKNLAKSVAEAKNLRELGDLREEELPTLETTSKDWPHSKEVAGIFQRIRAQIVARAVELQLPPSPADELKKALDRAPLAEGPGDWRWIAVHAGLGRLYTEAKQYDAAATAYRELSKHRDKFPEAGVGRRRVAGKFQSEGDRLLKSGDPASAIPQFRGGLDILSGDTPQEITDQGALRSRLGLAYVLAADSDKARSEFRNAIALYRQQGKERPGQVLGETCRQLLTDPKRYWAVDDAWNSFARELKDDDTLSSDLGAARDSISATLVNLLEKRDEASPNLDIPVVTPIVMEIGSGLIPEDTGKDWPLWRFILDMRGRFESHMGVRVPGVRVRGNNALAAGSYALLLDENWVAGGDTHLGMRYCPAGPDVLQALGIPSTALVSAPNPLTGQPGFWVAPEYWQLVSSQNIELWEEPLNFVVYHLEELLHQNLADFVGIQEVENKLEEWGKSEEDSAFITQALPDKTARVRFARVLRALAREQVPITSWKEILASAQDSGFAHLADAVRAARVCLKRELPGNAPATPHYELPPEWGATMNSWLKFGDGKSYFIPDGEQVHRFLLMLGDLVSSDQTRAALVVESPAIRPYVRRLVEWRFPYLTVLSKDEVVSQATSRSEVVQRTKSPEEGLKS